jgi:aspartate aminotransferase
VQKPGLTSATLAANEAVRALEREGRAITHLAFGEAGLPVPAELAERLGRAAVRNSYGPPMGSAATREAIAGYFSRSGIASDPANVMIAPGSKAIIFAILLVLDGPVFMPSPSWVSYEPQAQMAGKRVVRVPIGRNYGGVPDPEALASALANVPDRKGGRGVLLITVPDNPTGTIVPADVLRRVCDVARQEGLVVVSDEIYRDLAYDPISFVSPAAFYPEGTIVTSGLSKQFALGGWRIGFARFPSNQLGATIGRASEAVASEIWSCAPAPMEDVASFALSEQPELAQYVMRARRLHEAVALAVFETLIEVGAECRKPQAAFYLYPDFERLRPVIERAGASDGQGFAQLLLDRYGIAVLPGAPFGDDDAALRCRIATSLLYGDSTDRRLEALGSAHPTELPWIAANLAHIRNSFVSLVQ